MGTVKSQNIVNKANKVYEVTDNKPQEATPRNTKPLSQERNKNFHETFMNIK